jgi:hypothetical protein
MAFSNNNANHCLICIIEFLDFVHLPVFFKTHFETGHVSVFRFGVGAPTLLGPWLALSNRPKRIVPSAPHLKMERDPVSVLKNTGQCTKSKNSIIQIAIHNHQNPTESNCLSLDTMDIFNDNDSP